MTLQEKICVYIEASKYLRRNPERFSKEEMDSFLQKLDNFIDNQSEVIDDEVYDFLVASRLVNNKTREEKFMSYINKKYGFLHFNKIMDVGAGRMCKLSKALEKFGNKMYAIDPKIRLTDKEASNLGISISNDKFICDEYARFGKGTNIKKMDLIVGLEPCEATEHIIRQSLKYDKPFDISLCATPHDSLDGRKFVCYEDWYEYLQSISKEVDIKKFRNSYYASNNNIIAETEMER